MHLTFENPPTEDNPFALTADDIAKLLLESPGEWAIVARHDRAARSAQGWPSASRTGASTATGSRQSPAASANEHRVYARRVAS